MLDENKTQASLPLPSALTKCKSVPPFTNTHLTCNCPLILVPPGLMWPGRVTCLWQALGNSDFKLRRWEGAWWPWGSLVGPSGCNSCRAQLPQVFLKPVYHCGHDSKRVPLEALRKGSKRWSKQPWLVSVPSGEGGSQTPSFMARGCSQQLGKAWGAGLQPLESSDQPGSAQTTACGLAVGRLPSLCPWTKAVVAVWKSGCCPRALGKCTLRAPWAKLQVRADLGAGPALELQNLNCVSAQLQASEVHIEPVTQQVLLAPPGGSTSLPNPLIPTAVPTRGAPCLVQKPRWADSTKWWWETSVSSPECKTGGKW